MINVTQGNFEHTMGTLREAKENPIGGLRPLGGHPSPLADIFHQQKNLADLGGKPLSPLKGRLLP